MNSIIRNVNFLKVPLPKIKPASLKVNTLTRTLGRDQQNYPNTSHVNSIKCYHRLTEKTCRTALPQSRSRPTFKTTYKIRREYSQKFGKNVEYSKQVEKERKKTEQDPDPMTIRNGRVLKKTCAKLETNQNLKDDALLKNEDYDPTFISAYTEPFTKIKSVIAVNSKLSEEKKERTRMEQYCANKINYPVKSCSCCKVIRSKGVEVTEKNSKTPYFNSTKRSYSIAKKFFPKCEMKKREFKQDHYDEARVPKEHSDIYPYFVDKFTEAEIKKKNSQQSYSLIKGKRKECLPLYMVVKEMSEKCKGGQKNLVYKVCNNTASFKLNYQKKAISEASTFRYKTGSGLEMTTQPKLFGKDSKNKLHKLVTRNKENFLCIPDKRAEKRISNSYCIYSKSLLVNEEYTDKLTKTIRYLLQPVIEQEYMKYNELKSALDRLEKNMNAFFKPIQSLSERNDLNRIFGNNKNKIIYDPSLKHEIKEPLQMKEEVKDPSKKIEITAPFYKKEDIIDPGKPSVMIVKHFDSNACKTGSNKGDNCKENDSRNKNSCRKLEIKKDGCKEKKTPKNDSPCKRDTNKKKDPCNRNNTDKKKYQCKKDSPKKEVPCKKDTDKKSDPKKEDLCKKKEDSCNKKKDPCKKKEDLSKKKDDPCKNKDDPGKKKEDPCKKKDDHYRNKKDSCRKKEDSCKKEDETLKKKENPCKKKDDTFKKGDSCKKNDSSKNPCTKKDDLCKESDKSKKDDPCNNKNPREENKLSSGAETCRKKDPCKKEFEFEPFKKSKSKYDSFISAQSKKKPERFLKKEGEAVDPFKTSKSKPDTFFPPGGYNEKAPCEKKSCENICDELSNIPFKQKKKKEPFGKGDSRSLCKQEKESVEIFKKAKSKASTFSDPLESSEECKKKQVPCQSPCRKQKPCSSESDDKDSNKLDCFSKSTSSENKSIASQMVQQPCTTDFPQKLKEVPPKPIIPPPPPPPPPLKKCPPSAADTCRYCKKPEPKEVKVDPAPKGTTSGVCRFPSRPPPPPPKRLEPQQYPKNTWVPVKIKGVKPKTCTKSLAQKCKSESAVCKSKRSKVKESATTTRTSGNSKKGFLDGCKGLLASVCKMFCPGKSGPGKKGVAVGAITTQSMPDLRSYSQFKQTAQVHEDRKKNPKKRPLKDKYPWNIKRSTSLDEFKKEEIFFDRKAEKFFQMKSYPEHYKPRAQSCDSGLDEQRKLSSEEKLARGKLFKAKREKQLRQEKNTINVSSIRQNKSGRTYKVPSDFNLKKSEEPSIARKRLRMRMTAFGSVYKRNTYTVPVYNKIFYSRNPRMPQNVRSKSDKPLDPNVKKKKTYPWTIKNKDILEDCSKESLITKLSILKQREKEMALRAAQAAAEEECNKHEEKVPHQGIPRRRKREQNFKLIRSMEAKRLLEKSVKLDEEIQLYKETNNRESIEENLRRLKENMKEVEAQESETCDNKQIEDCGKSEHQIELREEENARCDVAKDIEFKKEKDDDNEMLKEKLRASEFCGNQGNHNKEAKFGEKSLLKVNDVKCAAVCQAMPYPIPFKQKTTSKSKCTDSTSQTNSQENKKCVAGNSDQLEKSDETHDVCSEKSDQNLGNQCVALSKSCSANKMIPYEENDSKEKCFNNEFFICEESKVGKCYQLVCKPMTRPQPLCKLNEGVQNRSPKVRRLLKCKLVHDSCGNQVLICKEIRMRKELDVEEEDEDLQTEMEEEAARTKRIQPKHEKKNRFLLVSKKLVCKEEVVPDTETKEMFCNVMEVKEIKENEEKKRKKCKKKGGKKASPFTYADLLKKSAEVRKAAEEELTKAGERKVDC